MGDLDLVGSNLKELKIAQNERKPIGNCNSGYLRMIIFAGLNFGQWYSYMRYSYMI